MIWLAVQQHRRRGFLPCTTALGVCSAPVQAFGRYLRTQEVRSASELAEWLTRWHGQGVALR
eukprot:3191281-Lingulodinium_polyedra.AAC.1